MGTPVQGSAARRNARRLSKFGVSFRHLLVPAVVLLLVGCGAGPAAPGNQGASPSSAAGPPAASTGSSTEGVATDSPSSPTGAPTGSAGSSTGAAATSPSGSPGNGAARGSTLGQAPSVARTTDTKPSGDLPGWKQVFEENFTAGDVPVGSFPGPLYAGRWSAGYSDGTPDTAGQASGGKSGYYPTKVLSVHDGVLDWYVHSENGISMGAAPQPKIPNASAKPARSNSFLYGRYSVRFRADSLAGFKTAWLFWPDSGIWPRDGEIDFPEGDLAGPIYGAAHFRGTDPNAFDKAESNIDFTSWHVATTEWTPGRVEFFLDGKSIGVSTTSTPTTPMHFILQTESCLTGCPLPTTQGHVYLDWISMWVPA